MPITCCQHNSNCPADSHYLGYSCFADAAEAKSGAWCSMIHWFPISYQLSHHRQHLQSATCLRVRTWLFGLCNMTPAYAVMLTHCISRCFSPHCALTPVHDSCRHARCWTAVVDGILHCCYYAAGACCGAGLGLTNLWHSVSLGLTKLWRH